jgi:hypothetical protein
MGWYFRKSVNLGPLRLNASRSGLGVSVGVPGLRVGTGPRGNYVTMGRGGIYYRQNFSTHSPSASGTRSNPAVPLQLPEAGIGAFHNLASGDVLAMHDATSADLLAELNRVQSRIPRMWLAGAVLLILFFVAQPATSSFVRVAALVVGAMVVVLSWRSDRRHGVTILHYELDAHAADAFEMLRQGLSTLAECRMVRHTSAAADVYDRKRNAGASQLLKTDEVRLTSGSPRRVRCNLSIPVLPAGPRTFYFFPDHLLVYDRGRVGTVSYHELSASASTTRFIEEGTPPSDAQVVDHTWRFVNKHGGPDRRFNNNRQLAVMQYGVLELTGAGSLRNRFMCSRPDAATTTAAAINQARRYLPSP